MKVLIADDDPVSRRLLQGYLQKSDVDVVVAGNGSEAWRLFDVGDFPLVITDWMMPGLDRPEFIGRIRSTTRGNYVYTTLLTTRSQKEDVGAGMDAGADDFLSKPFDRDELRVRQRAGQRIIDLEQYLSETDQALVEQRKLVESLRQTSESGSENQEPA